MAKKISKNETLQEAKERVRKAFRPSEEDPVVRFIGENGKMGLRHIFSEEVVEAPTHDFIDMPEAEVIEKERWEMEVIQDRNDKKWKALEKHLGNEYKGIFSHGGVFLYPPFDNYLKFEDSKTYEDCLFNEKGELVIPPVRHISVKSWYENNKEMYLTDVLEVCKSAGSLNLVYGYVRLDGTEVVPIEFGHKEAFEELMKLKPTVSEVPAWAYRWHNYTYEDKKTGLYGLKAINDEKETEAISTTPPKREGFANGKFYYLISREKDYFVEKDILGLIDETGKVILPCKYEYISLEEKFIKAWRMDKNGVFDLDGNPIVKCGNWDCFFEPGGLISARTRKNITLFNSHGQIVIDKGVYYDVRPNMDGVLRAEDLNYVWWYIDLWGNKMPVDK